MLEAMWVEPEGQEEWPRWVTPAHPLAIWVLVGVAFLVEPPDSLAMALLVVAATLPWAPFLVRRFLEPHLHTLLVLIPMAIVFVAGESLGIVESLGDDGPHIPMMILVWLVAEAGAVGPPRTALAFTTPLTLAVFVGRWIVGGSEQAIPFIWIFGALLALGGGLMVGRQARLTAELRRAQQAMRSGAALAERQRIAREVHDVIAHTLSVTMMHLTAARLANDRGDTDGTRDALTDAEHLGRQGLTDVRRTVGLLRSGSELATDPALPGLDDVPSLVAQYRSSGVDVDLAWSGDAVALDGPGALAAYRVVQESLANATRHAPGTPIQVRLTGDREELTIAVTNPAPARVRSAPTGSGLVGMRERVEQLGGAVTAGRQDGTWQVRATIPVTATIPDETGTAVGRGWGWSHDRCVTPRSSKPGTPANLPEGRA